MKEILCNDSQMVNSITVNFFKRFVKKNISLIRILGLKTDVWITIDLQEFYSLYQTQMDDRWSKYPYCYVDPPWSFVMGKN